MLLEDIKKGSDKPGDHGLPEDAEPEWLDKERFRRGQKFIQNNLFSVTLALHFSLVSGFSILNLLEPLVFTKQSGTPETALKRYLMTFKHLHSWVYDDVWNKEDPGYKSIRTVRRMHRNVAKAMAKEDDKKVNVSQYDMALVQSGFMGAIFMYPDSFGIKYTKKDLEDFVYFWRGVGFILGISDEYNMCQGSYDETCAICRDIKQKVLIPALLNPPKMFVLMADAYCNGLNMWLKMPTHTRTADCAVSMDAMGLPVPKLSLPDLVRFYIWKTVLFLCRWAPGFHYFMNRRTNLLPSYIDSYLNKMK